jgi:predicted aspartyl protease
VNEEHGFPWIFPYIEKPRHPGSLFRERPLLRPVVPVTFIGPDGPQQVFALVDSGADHILAAPWIAQAVGIDLHRAPEEPLKVAGGSHNVKFVTPAWN